MGPSNRIDLMLIEKAAKERRAVKVNFELLPVCNLNCKMCYIHSSMQEVESLGGLKTVDEWLEFAEELKREGVLFILLTGGEVFLYPEFKRLYIELFKMGFVLTVYTNATMIDEETVSWLRQYPPKCVSISLYGASDETYETLCGRKGMFTKVDNAIHLLRRNNIAVELKTLFTPLNYGDYEKCLRYAAALGISYKTDPYVLPPSRTISAREAVRFTPRQAVECMFFCNRVTSSEKAYADSVVKHLRKYEESKDIPGSIHMGLTCAACNYSAWITWQGHMIPCAIIDEPYTLPFENGFLNAWEELKAKTDAITFSSECSHCEKRKVCISCPASSYAETGHLDGTPHYQCEMTELTLKKMYEYVKENNIDIKTYELDDEETEIWKGNIEQ